VTALCQNQASLRDKVSLTEILIVCEFAHFQEAARRSGNKKALSCKRVTHCRNLQERQKITRLFALKGERASHHIWQLLEDATSGAHVSPRRR